jgi:hypothetical protein
VSGPAAQLDLFLDSHAVILANEIGAALLAGDVPHASELIRKARIDGREHPQLPALATLSQLLSEWRLPLPEVPAIADAVARLESEVVPCADVALGPQAPRLLTQLFQQLAELAQGRSYDPAYPSAHRAALCLRADYFSGAEQAAMAIPDALESPDALRWITIARYRMHGLEAARASLFAFAWRDPARMERLVAQLADETLERDWRAFEAASDWESIPGEALPAWFPVWYVMEHPAVAPSLNPAAFPQIPAAKAANELLRALDLEKQGNSAALAASRSRLRSLNAEFFDLYMARRKVRYG